MTPAFSPGPCSTHGALVGSPFRWIREDLYEQCSFHMAEKMPSSVKVGSRPISFRMRSYSSGLRPWEATSSGVIFGSVMGSLGFVRLLHREIGACGKGLFRPVPRMSQALPGQCLHCPKKSLHEALRRRRIAPAGWIGFNTFLSQSKEFRP